MAKRCFDSHISSDANINPCTVVVQPFCTKPCVYVSFITISGHFPRNDTPTAALCHQEQWLRALFDYTDVPDGSCWLQDTLSRLSASTIPHCLHDLPFLCMHSILSLSCLPLFRCLFRSGSYLQCVGYAGNPHVPHKLCVRGYGTRGRYFLSSTAVVCCSIEMIHQRGSRRRTDMPPFITLAMRRHVRCVSVHRIWQPPFVAVRL